MYNGIGLLTPRGSGTSGYVTANKFNLRRAPVQKDEVRRDEGPKQQKPNEEILLHNQKREIEVKLFELRLKLEDEDKLTGEEVDEMLAMERAVLEDNFSKKKAKEASKPSVQETHEVARRKQEQMERFRKALRIRPDAEASFGQQVQRTEATEMRDETERERRRHGKEEKKRRDAHEGGEKGRGERKKDRHKSREKHDSRERSPERERSPPGRETGRVTRREERSRSREVQKDDRWGPDSDKHGTAVEAEGRNVWQEERERGRMYQQRRYSDDGPPPGYRFGDQDRGPVYRGRFYDRGRFSRGRGRRFPGRSYRSYEMSGPGYYRIGEEAPERYDPGGDVSERRPEPQDRWQKVDLNAEEEVKEKPEVPRHDDPNRVGAYLAEYDAHGALGTARRDKRRERPSSPKPRSPSSIKQSPSQPKCYRRPADYRSATPSPSSKEAERIEEKRQRSPSLKSRSVSPREPRRTRPEKRHKRSPSRSPSAKSGSSRSSKSRDRSRSSSRSRSSISKRSDRDRRRDRSDERRRYASPRRYYDDRSRYYDHRRGGRYGGRWRQFDSYRGGYRGGYRGYRRPSYGYNPQGGYGNWRSDRRYDRRMSRSRSRSRRRRSRSFSSSSSGERKRGRSSSMSGGRSSPSDKRRRVHSTSRSPDKNKS